MKFFTATTALLSVALSYSVEARPQLGSLGDAAASGMDAASSGMMDQVKKQYTEQCLKIATGLDSVDSRIEKLCNSDPSSCKDVIGSQGITEPSLIEVCENYSEKAMEALSGAI